MLRSAPRPHLSGLPGMLRRMRQLVAFVTARLDEDEREAAACGPGDWYTADAFAYALADLGAPLGEPAEPSADLDADGRHAARHSPARTLCDVAAQRRLLLELTRPQVARRPSGRGGAAEAHCECSRPRRYPETGQVTMALASSLRESWQGQRAFGRRGRPPAHTRSTRSACGPRSL